ncbi:YqcC family protein [Thiolapillus sp.]
MNNDYQELSLHLQRLEKELRLQGWWSDAAPSADALKSTAPFCHDSMTFEQWLQWIFLPKLWEIIHENAPLPENCAIAPMAEIAWRNQSAGTVTTLIELLTKIDSCIGAQP